MIPKTRRFVGLGMLLAVTLALVLVPFVTSRQRETVTVRGLTGGSKIALLSNVKVRDILRQRYGLAVEYTERGSIAMVDGDTTGQDFLWPGSELAIERFRARGGTFVRTDTIFASPLVLYSWDEVTDVLERAGIARRESDGHYVVDLARLIKLSNDGVRWQDIGLPRLYGRINVFTSDPNKSNGGAMFAALLATVLNQGEAVDERSVQTVLPGVKQYYDRLGMLEATTADLFDKFLRTGIGANPIVVGYESELIEFALANPGYRDLLRQRVRVLYPQPTVWSSSPFLALTPNGARLLEALSDPEIRALAWETHGFRSGLIGESIDPQALAITGVPATVQSVMPLPRAAVFDQLLAAVK